MSLVLRGSGDPGVARLKQLQDAASASVDHIAEGSNAERRLVIAAMASVRGPDWSAIVEQPIAEAFAPLRAALWRTAFLLLAGTISAVILSYKLSHRMVAPIKTLGVGATRIGSGELGQRICIQTGDELEALAEQFNHMAARLQESYATLEGKVQERTQQLEVANAAKSRFLAAASHDLRQPLHALGLFLTQLRMESNPSEQERLHIRLEAAVTAMNELFNSLLDISRIDAGVLTPEVTSFPIERLLSRVEATFFETAREKGLRLRVVRSSAWIRSDALLLERILLNLVSNAVRYTKSGGVVVGCFRRGRSLEVAVCDTGPGIPADQSRNIFNEFYQLNESGRDGNRGGLGLGLAIVHRLAELLEHPISLTSRLGRGSRFAITLPVADAQPCSAPTIESMQPIDPLQGKLVFVIDDDDLVRESTSRLISGWGCRVIDADSAAAALTAAQGSEAPNLIISDYRLADGLGGIEAIAALRQHFGMTIPAFLVTGDTSPDRLRDVTVSGFRLLHKPVSPMALRALASWLLKQENILINRG